MAKQVRIERAKIRQRYMDLVLYPDEYQGSEHDYYDEIKRLKDQIRRFRYRSIRNFITEVFDDAMDGILEEDPMKTIMKGLRGYRDRIVWEEIAGGHQLIVNNMKSPWVDIKIPAEVSGYMAFRIAKNRPRIIRAINVIYFRIERD